MTTQFQLDSIPGVHWGGVVAIIGAETTAISTIAGFVSVSAQAAGEMLQLVPNHGGGGTTQPQPPGTPQISIRNFTYDADLKKLKAFSPSSLDGTVGVAGGDNLGFMFGKLTDLGDEIPVNVAASLTGPGSGAYTNDLSVVLVKNFKSFAVPKGTFGQPYDDHKITITFTDGSTYVYPSNSFVLRSAPWNGVLVGNVVSVLKGTASNKNVVDGPHATQWSQDSHGPRSAGMGVRLNASAKTSNVSGGNRPP